MEIVGRHAEQTIMQQCLTSDKSEFVAVYGRRRVGKTFLIREFFERTFTFYVTGLAKADKEEQLKNFNVSLSHYGKLPYPQVHSWMDAFRQLIYLLAHTKQKGKKVIFIDELPWLDTPRAGFITALEFFWNSWASSRSDILLVVCGSATSWMINKLIKNHGGLHHRVTRRIQVEPFTLGECEEFFLRKKIVMERRSIVECYMIFGGIPFYLDMVQPGGSLEQSVDRLFFAKNGELKNEFSLLYASLFKNSERHVAVVKALSKKAKGLTRDEIVEESHMQGGGLSHVLEELEQCGFVRRYQSFERKSKYPIYQLIDCCTLFHLHFVRNNANPHFWANLSDSARRRAWSGYAFELVCLMHEEQVKHKLGISGVMTSIASWRSLKSLPGAQVDLVIDRGDRVINLCEMKYANDEFVVDRRCAESLRNKRRAFISETQTRKAVHTTMVTTFGVKRNEYYFDNVQSEVKMDDLFCDVSNWK